MKGGVWLNRAARGVILLAPAALVALYGGAYLIQIGQTLLAPGVGVELAVATPRGPVRFSARSYAIDPLSGVARLQGVQVVDARGRLLARARSVRVVGLDIREGLRPKATLAQPFLRLRRLPGGQLDLPEYLPPQKGPPSDIPFEVEWTDGHLEFEDLAAIPGRRRPAPNERGRLYDLRLPRARVAGRRGAFVAAGPVTVRGIGDLRLDVAKLADPKGGPGPLTIRFATDRLDGVRLLAALRASPESRYLASIEGATAQRLTVAGKGTLRLPPNGRPLLRAVVTAQGARLAYRKERLAQATFRGVVTDAATSGRLEASDGPDRATFAGRFDYRDPKRLRLGGTLAASLAGSQRIKPYLPKGVQGDFSRGRFDGYLAYDARGPRAQGTLAAARVQTGKIAASGLVARLVADRDRLDLRLDQGVVNGAGLRGAGTLDLKTRHILGFAEAPKLSASLARSFAALPAGLVASASGAIAFEGPLADPRLFGSATVRGAYRLPNGERIVFEAPVALSGGTKGGQIGRAVIRTKLGTFAATGGYSAARGWDLNVSARGVSLRQLSPEARGRVDLLGRVTGKLADPLLSARVEGLGLGTEDLRIAAAAANLSADRRGVRIESVKGIKGAGAISGRGELVFAKQFAQSRLSADLSARGLLLSDLSSDVAGTIDVPQLKVAGTLQRTTLLGRIRAKNVVAAGERVGFATARFAFADRVARVTDIRAQVAGGEALGSARYDLARKSGSFDGSFEGIQPGSLTTKALPQVQLGGTVSGTASGSLNSRGLVAALIEANADDLTINGVALGSGPVTARLADRKITAQGEIGLLARYIRAESVVYDLDGGALGGRIEALGVPVPEVAAAARPYVASEEARGRLLGIGGTAGVALNFSGTAKAPVVEIESLTGTALTYGGIAYGDLAAAGTYANGSVNLTSLKVDGPNGTLQASGLVGRDGTLDLSAHAANLGVDLLRPFLSNLPSLDARIDTADFALAGTTAAPNARGSLLGSVALPEAAARFGATGAPPLPKEPGAKDPPAEQAPANRLSLNLFDVRVEPDANGVSNLSARGLFSAVGFTGDVSASAPIGKDVADTPVAADLVLRPRKLSEITSYFPGLTIKGSPDPNGVGDEVSGSLQVRGTPKDLVATGTLNAKAGEIGYEGVSTRLQNATLSAQVGGGRLALEAAAKSSYGGGFAFSGSTSLADLLAGKPLADPLARDLRGTLQLDALRGYQKFSGGAFVDARATTPSPLALGGTLRRPSLTGSIAINRLDTVLPTFGGGEDTARQYVIEPVLDLVASIEDTARIRTTAADITLGGGGTATGPLSKLQASADLILQKGTLRLPGGTVRLDPGGTLALRYDAAAGQRAGGVAARLDTDLTGRTQITALRNNSETERYDITLEVTGDLLAQGGGQNGLNLTARSDPPDLSQDRILQLLGQTDIVTGFLDTRDQRALENQLRSALTGYALPSFFSGFTDAIAREFGFDYVNVDYNAFEGASLAFAKTLSPGLTFSGRRQLSAPQPGLPQRYDVRLGYRPRRGSGYLRSLSVSIGTDELRPYKLSFDYSTRFGRNNPPLRVYSLGVKQ